MQIVAARSPEHWDHAAALLFAYHREAAADLGFEVPAAPADVWPPVAGEVADPASAFDSYFVAYEGTEPVGGTAVVAHDELSVEIRRCYVERAWRRRGVATAFTAAVLRYAERADADRVVVEVPHEREGALEAWHRLGFVAAEPWGDGTRVYLERRLDE